VIAVAFLPVLALEGQEGKLFRPLAYTKNFAMVVAAVLALTLDPALRLLLGARRRILAGAGGRVQRALKSLAGRPNSFARDHPITRSAHAVVRANSSLDSSLEDAE